MDEGEVDLLSFGWDEELEDLGEDVEQPAPTQEQPAPAQDASQPSSNQLVQLGEDRLGDPVERQPKQQRHERHQQDTLQQGQQRSLAQKKGERHKQTSPQKQRQGQGQGQQRRQQAYNSALDFESADFDPLLALSTPGLPPPVPDVRPMDYVAKCRVLLPPDIAQELAPVKIVGPASEASKQKHEALKQRALSAQQRIRDANPRITLETIMGGVREGPLQLLAGWAAQGARVRVVTRHAAGVRGTATGMLRCFDRFMNLLLLDVHEVYTVVLKVPRVRPKRQGQQQEQQAGSDAGGGGAPRSSSGAAAEDDGAGPEAAQEQQALGQQRQQVRWCRKQERRQRRLAQIFIKGDSVVMLSAAPRLVPEQEPAAGATV